MANSYSYVHICLDSIYHHVQLQHAYYLDHQERRGEYVSGYFDQLVNWNFAKHNLKDAMGKGFVSDAMHQVSHRGLPLLAAAVSANWAKHRAIRMLFRQS